MAFRILETPQTPSVGEDIALGAGTGLTEGGAGLAGAFGDIPAASKAVLNRAMQFVQDHTGGGERVQLPATPPVNGGIGNVLVDAISAIARKAGTDPRLARLAMAITNPSAALSAPTSAEVRGAMTGDKPLYQPQTKAGKYARTIAQFAPAAIAPGGVVRKVASVVVPGVASEAAGQATEGTPYEPYARIAAALAGGAATSLVGRPGPSTQMLAEASRGASDEQIAAARQLMERSQSLGGPQLTMAEAVQQVTNSGTGMGRLQRVIEGTKAGAEEMQPVMAARPGAVRQAVTNFADTVAPATDQPSMIGAQAQNAAESGLTGVRRYINSVAEPNYQALAGQEIPAAEYAQLAHNPSYTEALAALRAHPELGASVAHLPDNNMAVVNEVIKRVNTMADQARPSPVLPGDNGLAAIRDQAAGAASQIASNASPEYSAARQGVAAGRQAYLEPLQRGPVGAIAGTDSVKAQTAALFPTQPLEGAPAETRRALEMIAQQDPQIAANLTRQHLVNALHESTQDLQGGMNQYGGARYAAAIAGNPEQERTLLAGVQASGADPQRLQSIVEVLRATGKRQPPGSLTAYNSRDIEELGKAGAMGEVLRTGLNPPGMFRRLGLAFQDWQTERNAGKLAQAIIAQPDQAEQILMHARRVVPHGSALNEIERLALTVQEARQPQLEGR